MSFRLCLVSLITMALTVPSLAEDSAAKTKLKGLLITGGCCHDYENQKLLITEGVSQRVSISWDIVHEGESGRDHKVSVYQQPGWAKKYDVIVHNECFGGVTDDDFVKSIAAAHFEGVPAVFIHCALHSYRNSPMGADSWRELIGVTSRNHGKKRSVTVKTTNADHPIMKGFPQDWKSPNGELYNIEKVWPNCMPLATAYGEDNQKDHTVIWANTFGKAKVFGTSLGHHNETMNNNEWPGLLSRGVLWSVGKLNDDGTPMGGYAGIGIKPIQLPEPKPTPDPKFKKSRKAEAK